MNPYTRPDWPPPPHPPPPRRRPAWLTPVLASAVTAVVTGSAVAGIALLMSNDERSSRSSAATSRNTQRARPTTASPAPTGTFVKVERLCEFISRQTTGELVPNGEFQMSEATDSKGQRESAVSSCAWNNLFTRQREDVVDKQRDLKVYVRVFNGSGSVTNTEQYFGFERTQFRERANTRGKFGAAGTTVSKYGPFVQVPGMGEDAFLQYTERVNNDPVLPDHTSMVELRVRLQNVAVQVDYSGSDKTINNVDKQAPVPLGPAAVRRGAETVATQVIKGLAACATCRA